MKWSEAPVVDDAPETIDTGTTARWQSAPVVESGAARWMSAPAISEESPKTEPSVSVTPQDAQAIIDDVNDVTGASSGIRSPAGPKPAFDGKSSEQVSAELTDEINKQPPWSDVLTSLPTQAVESAKLGLAGVLRAAKEHSDKAIEDAANSDDPEVRERARRQIDEEFLRQEKYPDRDPNPGLTQAAKARLTLQEATPENMTFWQQATSSAAQSLGVSLPGLGMSVVTGSPAPAMITMTGSEFGHSYDEARNAGLGVDDATRYAGINASVEYLTEKIPLNTLLKGAEGKGLFKFLVRLYGQELAGENVATLLQNANEFSMRNPAASMQEWADGYFSKIPEQAALTSASTAIVTTAQGGAAHGARRAVGLEEPKESIHPAESARADLESVLNDNRPYDAIKAERVAEAAREADAVAQQQSAESARLAQAGGLPAPGSQVYATVGDEQLSGSIDEYAQTDQGLVARLRSEDGNVYDIDPAQAEIRIKPEGEGTKASPIEANTAEDIADAAEVTEEEPTPAQKEADNYSKGRFRFSEGHPLAALGDIAIETAKGKERTASDGSWSVTMPVHYGHLTIAEGSDGDKADVFIGDDIKARKVYVIDQINPDTKAFDETKSMIGFSSMHDAIQAYENSFSDGRGRERIGDIEEMTAKQFLARAKSNNLNKPVRYVKPKPVETTSADTVEQGEVNRLTEQVFNHDYSNPDINRQAKQIRTEVMQKVITVAQARQRFKKIFSLLKERQNAENVRSNPRQVRGEGNAVEGGEEARRHDLQRQTETRPAAGNAQGERDQSDQVEVAHGPGNAVPGRRRNRSGDHKRDDVHPNRGNEHGGEHPQLPDRGGKDLERGSTESEARRNVAAKPADTGAQSPSAESKRGASTQSRTVAQQNQTSVAAKNVIPKNRVLSTDSILDEIKASESGVDIDGKSATWRNMAKRLQRDGKVRLEGNRYVAVANTVKFSAGKTTPTFYSALVRNIESVQQPKAPAEQWKAIIKNLTAKGVKQDEVDWTGVTEWLDEQKGSVTKDDLLDFVRANQVQVNEVMLGEGGTEAYQKAAAKTAELQEKEQAMWREIQASDAYKKMSRVEQANLPWWAREIAGGSEITADAAKRVGLDEAGLQKLTEYGRLYLDFLDAKTESDRLRRGGGGRETKYANYTLPGGDSYRELLLTLPPKSKPLSESEQDDVDRLNALSESRELFEAERSKLDRLLNRESGVFRSSHFQEPNIVAHVRFKDRTDADGKRVLFIEEFQSDWAQKGKREGFKATPNYFDFATAKWRESEHQYHADFSNGKSLEVGKGVVGSMDEAKEYIERLANSKNSDMASENMDRIPSGPFVTKTDSWVSLALKRMIRYASEHGYDRIAWTTGEQQADRYDLSKQIDAVDYYKIENGMYRVVATKGGSNILAKDFREDELPEVVGKEIAEKMIRGEGEKSPRGTAKSSMKRLTGIDLKIGGEGMKAFYDQIVPSIVNKYVKKWGAKVGTTDINLTEMPDSEYEKYDRDHPYRQKNAPTVHSVDVTPQMRDAALAGQPLFSAGQSNDSKLRLVTDYWQRIAADDKAFQYTRTSAKDFADVVKAMARGRGWKAGEVRFGRDTGYRVSIPRQDEIGTYPRTVLEVFDANSDTPYVVIGDEHNRSIGGSLLYQIAMTWAHNNGKTLNPDSTITMVNRLRRTEAMISSALRFGTTRHLKPHQDQYVGLLNDADYIKLQENTGHPRNIAVGLPQVDERLKGLRDQFWKPESDRLSPAENRARFAYNLYNLLRASSDLAYRRESALKRVGFDPATGFYDLRGDRRNSKLSDSQISELLAEAGYQPDKAGVGLATAKRAIVTRSLLQQMVSPSVGGDARVGSQRLQDWGEGLLYQSDEGSLFSDRFLANRADVVARVKNLAQQINPQANLAFVDKMFGEGEAFARSGGQDKAPAAGSYEPARRLITVALNYADPENTLRHETIHDFREMGLLKDTEWRALESEADKTWKQTYGVDDTEEAIAYAFGDYRGGKQFETPIQTIFNRIRNFLIRIANALRGMGFNSVDDVFQRIQRGEVAARERAPQGMEAVLYSAGKSDEQTPSKDVPDWLKGESKDVQEAARKAGVWAPKKTLKQRFDDMRENLAMRLTQGLVDQFAPIKTLNYKAYMLARLTKSSDAALEAMLFYGKPYIDNEGAVAIHKEEGGLIAVLQKLQGEHDRFFAWIAGNRAAQLKQEGRENLFTDKDITALKNLSAGNMPDGKPRAAVYAKVLREFNAYSKSVLDMAEQTGLVDPEARKVFEKDYYVPFYRVIEDENRKVQGPSNFGGLTQQYAFKKLKGGEEALNDLLQNTLRNWSHLMSASLKNQAAARTILAAVKAGVAKPSTAMNKDAVWFSHEGRKVYVTIDDPFVLDAISALEWSGFKGTPMRAMSKFKHYLTFGVTISPTFRIRNLIRDSLQAMAVTPVSGNVVKNLYQGWKVSEKNSKDYADMLAGGALMRFGMSIEGEREQYIKDLIDKGVDQSTILDSKTKVRLALEKAWEFWKEVGDKSESVTRAAIYKQLREAGKSHLEASFEARDSMDFSMQGTWPAVRMLTQVVPFMNARAQGLYKLGRDGLTPTTRAIYNTVTGKPVDASDKKKAIRFGAVLGATSLASIALLLAYRDDPEWQKREEWDRNNFWWFKIGNKAFRIPKPFEIGAIATAAERGVEAIMAGLDKDSRKRFSDQLWSLLMENLSMNPTPQLVKPWIDIYANKDSFTGRPIESDSMERLSKPERMSPNTSTVAKVAGKTGVLSPVQIDHLIRAYFGWLGAHAVMTVDLAMQPFSDVKKPTPRTEELFVIGDFLKDLPANESRYVTMFYENARDIQQAMADRRYYAKLGNESKVESIEADKGEKLSLFKLYERAQDRVSKINKEIKSVRIDASLSAQEKRRQLDSLYKDRNDLVYEVEQARKEAMRDQQRTSGAGR